MDTGKQLLAGAMSAVVSRTTLAPLERVKMDIVLHRKHGVIRTAQGILRTDGLPGFWHGCLLNIMRTAPFKASAATRWTAPAKCALFTLNSTPCTLLVGRVLPALSSMCVQQAVNFCAYDVLRRQLMRASHKQPGDSSVQERFMAGALSGNHSILPDNFI